MMFRDLKSGDNLYIYDRSAIDLSVQKVVSVSVPRMEKQANGQNSLVIDIVVDNKTYTMKDTSEIGYTPNNLILSPDKLSILREVEAQKANNEALLARVDSIKAELPKLESVIDTLSPERKEKKQNEERLTRLEDSIGSLKDMMELILKNKGNGKKSDD